MVVGVDIKSRRCKYLWAVTAAYRQFMLMSCRRLLLISHLRGKGLNVFSVGSRHSIKRCRTLAVQSQAYCVHLHLALGQSEADDYITPTTGGILLPGGSLVIKLLQGEENQGACDHSFLFIYTIM